MTRRNHLIPVGLALAAAIFSVVMIALAPSASAKQAIDFFGNPGGVSAGTLGGQFTAPTGIAVNDSGAGPADVGDVYVADSTNNSGAPNRVQRFGRDDNGTPADTADDSYFFISAWGADVDSTPSGGTDFEICTLASECKAAVASGGNGTAAGNGALSFPIFSNPGVAVDQDTGEVYITDPGNARVDVYDGVGNFLSSFGFDVDATTPGAGYEVCPATDTCKAGLPGAGAGQVGFQTGLGGDGANGIAVSAPDGNTGAGTVFLADTLNRRINTYDLDGSSPASIGSAAVFESGQPQPISVDSRGILYASNAKISSQVERYDTKNVNGGGVGFLSPIPAGVNERQEVKIAATAGTFRLSFDPDGGGPMPAETTSDLSFDIPTGSSGALKQALEALPSLNNGDVSVSGGPGDATGSNPYKVTFDGAYGAEDVAQLLAANGATPLSGGAGASVTTTTPGQFGLIMPTGVFNSTATLAVDPDGDGAGPDADTLYTSRAGANSVTQQLGPVNAPGLLLPPSAEDARHAANGIFGLPQGLAVEPSTGRLYLPTAFVGETSEAGRGVYVLGDTGPSPTATLDSCDTITAHSLTCQATIDPNGPPATRYHFEYSTDGDNWSSTPTVFLGAQEDPQQVEETIEPGAFGLDPNTTYHVRVLAARKFATPVITSELTPTTDAVAPLAETAGAPVRTTTTAQLNGRVTPFGSAATYRFEYGASGPCSSNPCATTAARAAGSGQQMRLVAAEITGLDLATTYHYRLITANGVGSPVAGEDMALTTRASDELPNQSDDFPGPPGSDRAWELVSLPDAGGNPVTRADAFSDDGNRVAYGIAGGTPVSVNGSAFAFYLAQRDPEPHPTRSWQPLALAPLRSELVGSGWGAVRASDDLSAVLLENNGEEADLAPTAWLFGADGSDQKLFQATPPSALLSMDISADGVRIAAVMRGGSLDPAHPVATSQWNLYQLAPGAEPQLASFLPGEAISACGVTTPLEGATPIPFQLPPQHSRWLGADGHHLYFPSRGNDCSSEPQLYVRDLIAGQTELLSGPPVSGPACAAALIRSLPGAAFIWTQSRLDAADTEPATCVTSPNGGTPDGDVYRYDVAAESLDCVTCAAPGLDANVAVNATDAAQAIAVAEDGSRVYFSTATRLLPEAPPDGTTGVYRVNVATGDLAYVAPTPLSIGIDAAENTTALTADGTQLYFSRGLAVNPALDPVDGMTSAGTNQVYRYDDTDRSLICVTCPQDGSPPLAPLGPEGFGGAADDGTVAFSTRTPLLGADQNTPPAADDALAGTDVYEWRDGRHLLITDGLTNWSGQTAPIVVGLSPSGRDVYFRAPARYTPDAVDDYLRFYDARIGGGIDFPQKAPPCPLEVCQGTPKGPPSQEPPGTSSFRGPGNPPSEGTKKCPKGKHRKHGRCVKKPHHKRANHRAAGHNRRNGR